VGNEKLPSSAKVFSLPTEKTFAEDREIGLSGHPR
jgi:hypothetical protein